MKVKKNISLGKISFHLSSEIQTLISESQKKLYIQWWWKSTKIRVNMQNQGDKWKVLMIQEILANYITKILTTLVPYRKIFI